MGGAAVGQVSKCFFINALGQSDPARPLNVMPEPIMKEGSPLGVEGALRAVYIFSSFIALLGFPISCRFEALCSRG